MFTPYKKRRTIQSIRPEEDEVPLEETASSKTLCLGIVHPGSYEPWVVEDAEGLKPQWIVQKLPVVESQSSLLQPGVASSSSGNLLDRSSVEVANAEDAIPEDDPNEFIQQMKKDLDLQHQMLRLLRIAHKTAKENWIKTPFKLAGLEGRGEAEVLKLLFLVADQALDDERFTAEQIEDLKGQTPYGEFPTISKCGMTFGNATAISMALATKFQLFGETVQEQLVVGATYSRLRNLQDKNKRTLRWVTSGQVKEKTKIEWAQSQLLHVILPPAVKEWDKQICSTKGPFLVESGMTLADIAIVDFLNMCSSHVVIDGLLADYLGVSDLIMAVRSCPKLLAHLQDREED